MKTYSFRDAPLTVFGVPFFSENGILERVPEEVRRQMPRLGNLGRRCPGARIGFRTDAAKFTVKMTLETLSVDIGMSLYACQAANVLIGGRGRASFAGLVVPHSYNEKTVEQTFTKASGWDDVLICLPRNEVIADITVTVDDDANVAPPTPYRYPTMLFYGSSITEGGCCARLTNAYTALLSERLNVDYINYGFSGAAKGEEVMADLISRIPMSVFVYDYDHNAPNPQHLRDTHAPFFRRIREKNPELPVIMLSRPNYFGSADDDARRAVIRETYENARADGDRNVWFIDGAEFFGETHREDCTVDRTHPNDLGFTRMADRIEPLLAQILAEKYPTL